MKPRSEMVVCCERCGRQAARDESGGNEAWAVFDTSKPCECGGRFVVQIVPAEPKSDAEVDAYLRACGEDPDEIARGGREFVERKLARAVLDAAEGEGR